MKISIRARLFIGISLFVLIIVGIAWILNTQFLEDYYINKKKDNLLEYVEKIDSEYAGYVDNIEDEISVIENEMAGSVSIYKLDGEALYISQRGGNMGGKGGQGQMLQSNSPWIPTISINGLSKVLDQGVVFENKHHNMLQIDFLVMGYKLRNSDILLLQIPLASIQEGADVANDFYLYIGILSVAIGTVIAFIFAKRFTRPILELNDITKSLANLNFSKKSQIRNKDELGELAGNINYLSTKLDTTISELNEANIKLQKDIERERQIDEMRKQFISSVSHELKTPITLIQGYAEGLKDDVMEDRTSKEYYCDVIIDESSKMDRLVKDLLQLSQLESGHSQLNKETFDITKLIKDVLDKYKPIFEEKDIKIITQISNSINVHADIGKIEQVIKNYLNNAINHIDDEKVIKINVIDDSQDVNVKIFNTGNPIPEDELDNIWISFYKVDKSRTREYGGTGLGLSIVQRIIELHKGKVGVSNLHDGVEFWFQLNKA